jgi:hypothetical protein
MAARSFFHVKNFLGREQPGGCVLPGVPWLTNGIGEIYDVGCQPSIIVRGELKVLPLLRVPHLWLTVRTRAGPGAGAGGWPWRWALGGWGWGHAGQQQGKAVTSAGRASQAGSMAGMGDPPYTTYLSIHKAWQWHGSMAG